MVEFKNESYDPTADIIFISLNLNILSKCFTNDRSMISLPKISIKCNLQSNKMPSLI